MRKFLAVDIGASGGRHIIGEVRDGLLYLREVYRFANGAERRGDHLRWDTERLFREIIAGFKACAGAGETPDTVAIDTWGVDYVLLDGGGSPLGEVYSYRDARTDGVRERTAEIVPLVEQYRRTGTQPQTFNTVYQLLSPGALPPGARRLLFLPEYLNYLLTGNMAGEVTVASTSGLLGAGTREWDYGLIRELGLPEELFGEIHAPGYEVGEFTPEVAREAGFSARVVLCPSHDTASAVLAVPEEGALYISSGTWSLLGTELPRPVTTPESLAAGFTNEAGAYGSTRYLKNIMGLWMLQRVRREMGDPGFETLPTLAEGSDFSGTVDVNDPVFLNPADMRAAVKGYLAARGERVPESDGDTVRAIYHSLAGSYRETAEELRAITGKRFARLHIVGGGSRDGYLNRLTEEATGLTVVTGPVEATATGNILSQMIASGEVSDAAAARRLARDSLAAGTIK